MKKVLGVLLLAVSGLLIGVEAHAASGTGNDLKSHCNATLTKAGQGGFEAGLCMATIATTVDLHQAITDSAKSALRICMPAGVTNGQSKDVVMKWMRENPAMLHYPAPTVVYLALLEAWPCPKAL